MNKVILMGRLTRDPEVRYSAGDNSTAVARYTLAVNRRFKRDNEPTADFVPCVAFGKAAEFAEKWFRQGMQVAISGRKGTQNGLDKTNELGDNLSEYSGKFAQAGYSAQEYFQLLQNGLDNGAYNLDKVNDAINEVTTRLVDGTIADSLSKIDEKTGEVQAGTGGWSKEVEDVFKQWQQGGATQKDVIDAIVTDIQNTENQQDKLNKAALAFGTMAEDGNAKFIESLTSVGNTYDDVAGSAENLVWNTAGGHIICRGIGHSCGHSGYRIYGHPVKFVGHDKADGAQYLGKSEKFCGSNSNKFERFCNPGAPEPERICIPEVAGNEAERTRQLGEFKEQCGSNRTKSERVSGAGVPQHGFRNWKRTEQPGINCAERILVSNQLYHITAKPGGTVGTRFHRRNSFRNPERHWQSQRCRVRRGIYNPIISAFLSA